MRASSRHALVLLALLAPGAVAGGRLAPGEQKAWRARGDDRDGAFVIVKKDGNEIRAEGPFEVRGGEAFFRIVISYGRGPVTSIPLAQIDIAATEKANAPRTPPPAAPERSPGPVPGVPIYDTREISAALETDAMRAERDRIRRKREEDRLGGEKAPPPRVATPAPKADQLEPAEAALAKQGRVQRGMRRAAVVMAWGSPDKQETVTYDGQGRLLWTYLVRGRAPMMVTLVDDVVIQLQQDERLLFTAALDGGAPAP